eukprot:g20493.t1
MEAQMRLSQSRVATNTSASSPPTEHGGGCRCRDCLRSNRVRHGEDCCCYVCGSPKRPRHANGCECSYCNYGRGHGRDCEGKRCRLPPRREVEGRGSWSGVGGWLAGVGGLGGLLGTLQSQSHSYINFLAASAGTIAVDLEKKNQNSATLADSLLERNTFAIDNPQYLKGHQRNGALHPVCFRASFP